MLDNDKIGRIAVYHITRSFNDEPKIVEISLVDCSREIFPDMSDTLYSINMKGNKCLPIDQAYELEGSYKASQHESYF